MQRQEAIQKCHLVNGEGTEPTERSLDSICAEIEQLVKEVALCTILLVMSRIMIFSDYYATVRNTNFSCC